MQALEDAKINWREEGGLEKLNLMRCGILIGTAMGGMQTFATAVEDLMAKVLLLLLVIQILLLYFELIQQKLLLLLVIQILLHYFEIIQ